MSPASLLFAVFVRCFICGSFFLIYVLCLSCFFVCSLQPGGHLLGKGWPLGSLVCDVFCECFVTFSCGVLEQKLNKNENYHSTTLKTKMD